MTSLAPAENAELERMKDMFAPEPLDPELAAAINPDGPLGPTIHHPLVISVGYVPDLNKMLNRQLWAKRKAVENATAAGNWSQVIWMHERPYRRYALKRIAAQVDDQTYWKLLGSILVDSENLFQWGRDLRSLLTAKRPHREYLMDEDERAALAALPDTLTIWRGYDRRNLHGWSWTLDRAKAEWFARRWADRLDRRPRLAEASVARSTVIAHFTGRGESEILIDPRDVRIIKTAQVAPR